MEVPTIISYSLLRTVEQTIDIPVPQARRMRSEGLQSPLLGQGSTADVEQNVAIPAPQRRRKRSGGFQGFFPG